MQTIRQEAIDNCYEKNIILLIITILMAVFITSTWAQEALTEDEQKQIEEYKKIIPSYEAALLRLLKIQRDATKTAKDLDNQYSLKIKSCETRLDDNEKLLQSCGVDKPTGDCQTLSNTIEALKRDNKNIRNSLETGQKIVEEAETLRPQLETVKQENQNLQIKVTDLETLKANLSIQLGDRQARLAELGRQNTLLTETNQKIMEDAETSRQMLETAKQENQTLQIKVIGLETLKAKVNDLSIQLEERQARLVELERQNTLLNSQLRQARRNTAEKHLTRPSFDCSKAKTVIEIAICNDGELSSADGQLGNLYQQLVKSLSKREVRQLKQEQLQWLKQRDASCLDLHNLYQKNCLLQLYEKRISELSDR